VEGLHITEAIATQKNLLRGFGGHPMAAGLSFAADRFNEFRRGLGRAIEKQLGEVVRAEPALQIDAWLELDELTLELADSLETLAPFGAGNPSLTLATSGVQLKSVSTIGKTKEHLRLVIEDESGNGQNILWWGGAGEALPEEGNKFDIAYSLRASTYRGQKQLTLQFEEFRAVEEKLVEVRTATVEIRDLRLNVSTFKRLNVETLVWAEGSERSKGKSRFDLYQADEFAIYTTPPSSVELQKAMQIVKPGKVYLFAIPPGEEKPEDFLNRLAGLCKYALNQRDGKTTVQELAVAMAARQVAIRIGLEWLGAGGQVKVQVETEQVMLSAKKTEPNPYLQAELFIALKGILNESSAYRKYFAKAEAESLFK
jgi:single-stranded-DNA-specific exonuclease